MKSKTLLTTTAMAIATTAAFGAASLRAPQIGGTATVATPTATNTARAGTLRAQTMKTSSVSTPSVTTTQSIATPVSTETTDARIALLKGIKGFNPGKIKDTTAATNELNAIDSRIEELQSKLDQAEAAADQTAKLTDVYTKEQVEAKIDEKISAIGTSISAKETYSKEEVDNLLTALEKKLPKIDDRGNMTWTDPNIGLLSYPIYWYIKTFSFVGNQLDRYGYSGTHSDSTIKTWADDICSANFSDTIACCLKRHMNAPELKMFDIISYFHGYHSASYDTDIVKIQDQYFLRKRIRTYEEDPLTYLHDEICGLETPENECWVHLIEQTPTISCGGETFVGTLAYVYQLITNPTPSPSQEQTTD